MPRPPWFPTFRTLRTLFPLAPMPFLPPPPSTPYHPSTPTWPYSTSHFRRHDSSPDATFYTAPRFVTHIDAAAIARLTQYYSTVLPHTGCVLDLCTSWKTFYPVESEEAVRKGELEVWGIGLNGEEMRANRVFMGFNERSRVLDLNAEPFDIQAAWGRKGLKFDGVTCAVSIDYLSRPLEVLRSVRACVREGGKVHLVVSNRCFPTKVVRIWLECDEQQRLQLVGDYLHFSGWKDIEIIDLCARDINGKRATDDHGTVLPGIKVQGLTEAPQHLDPLWVVRGTK